MTVEVQHKARVAGKVDGAGPALRAPAHHHHKRPSRVLPQQRSQMIIKQPLLSVDAAEKFDILVRVAGGGASGQAGAIRHGISRALTEYNAELRGKLKKEGFLTRDPRMKERKKYGQRGARARFQFSKR